MYQCSLVLLLLAVTLIHGFPKPPDDPHLRSSTNKRSAPDDNGLGDLAIDSAAAASYLGQFGYMSKTSADSMKAGGIVDLKSFQKSIMEFQRMAGLEATGELDADTARMMAMPRCGVEDTVGSFTMGSSVNEVDTHYRDKKARRKANRRKKKQKERQRAKKRNEGKSRGKRYALEGGKWPKLDLKYKIDGYTNDMTQAEIDDSIKRAWQLWSDQTQLTFKRTNSAADADVRISFGSRDHGDYYPFDGPGGTLAHAFFPTDGRAHFDDDERFTYEGNSGINLFIVAAHEFGHALGLGHSSVPDSLMAPFYQGYVADYQLHQDDIAGIQQLYGKKKTPTGSSGGGKDRNKDKNKPKPKPDPVVPTEPNKKPKDAMDICGNDVSFDAVFFDERESTTIALKGKYFWKITDKGVSKGYPKKINSYWKDLPGNLDAAVYSRATRRTYFFKGNRVWRYDGQRLEGGFPANTSLLGLPTNLNAAMQWGSDGMIYVFKKDKFYRFSEYSRYDGRSYGQWSMEKYWPGIPKSPDAAIQWKNGKTYFFKGEQFYQFSDESREVDKGYPKSTKKYWVGCSGKKSQPYTKNDDKTGTKKKNNKNNKDKKKNKENEDKNVTNTRNEKDKTKNKNERGNGNKKERENKKKQRGNKKETTENKKKEDKKGAGKGKEDLKQKDKNTKPPRGNKKDRNNNGKRKNSSKRGKKEKKTAAGST